MRESEAGRRLSLKTGTKYIVQHQAASDKKGDLAIAADSLQMKVRLCGQPVTCASFTHVQLHTYFQYVCVRGTSSPRRIYISQFYVSKDTKNSGSSRGTA